MNTTVDALNYEQLVSEFNNKLVTQLRNHGAEVEFLEMWVPDEDPVRSIQNMVEAAQAYGQSAIRIRVSKGTITTAQVEQLRAEVRDMGSASAEAEGSGSWLITVTGL